MSLEIVGHFQKAIYEILVTDNELKKQVQSIYLTKPQDAKYPFVLVSILNLRDLSKFKKTIFEVEFEIDVFSRDKVSDNMLEISNRIAILLDSQTIGLADAYVVSLKRHSLEWVSGKELGHNKIEIKYKSVIGGANADA
ncbi:MAG: hypothetical protein RLZZ59_734 [Pseudomonadota bacterium]|jgi:hypothetical protein